MYPDGNGDPDCPECGGRGVVPLLMRGGTPSVKRCSCVLRRALIDNMNRGWKGLSKIKPKKKTPLLKKEDQNLWVTASERVFKSHLLSLGIRKHADWHFKVVSDADLITAWLGSYSVKGAEIFDPDVSLVSSRHMNLVDLIEPPELLIIRLGVKKARNQAMGEVFWESLQHRIHIGKPVWIVDSQDDPLSPSHICWVEGIQHLLVQWDHITLETSKKDFQIEPVQTQTQHRITPIRRSTTIKTPTIQSSSTGSCFDELLANEDKKEFPKKNRGWGKKK